MKFEKGDIVQVHYSSPDKTERWMKGWDMIGPGDVGVVAIGLIEDVAAGYVTIIFPMIGTKTIHSNDLKIVAKASEK